MAAARRRGRLPEFEQLRDQARDVKNHVLAHLDYYLERFEAQVTAAGGQVHLGRRRRGGPPDHPRHLPAGRHAKTDHQGQVDGLRGDRLNDAWTAEGYRVIETDLGEYIIQLAGEPPPHHRPGHPQDPRPGWPSCSRPPTAGRKTTVGELVTEARWCCATNFQADVGITGGNHRVARPARR